MTLQIHRAERADRLATELGEVLRTPLADPFAVEIVAVPTQGVERWLAQRLSHQLGTAPDADDGVCAGIEFVSPRRLTATALASVASMDPDADPWQPHRAVWPLLTVIDNARGQDWAALLWSYLGDRPAQPIRLEGAGLTQRPATVELNQDQVRGGRRWSTARRLAELFAVYASTRPVMIQSWLAGHDVDGSGRALPKDRGWQAELWRRLRAELGTPSPAELLVTSCDRLAADPSSVELPSRVSVFGATRLSPEHRAVLSALAAHRDVHLWLPHPSPGLWQRVSERLPEPSSSHVPGASAGQLSPGPRAADPTAEVGSHPLLAYLGRDSRELQLTLAAAPVVGRDVHYPAAEPNIQRSTLLALLQDDLAHDRPYRAPAERPLLAPDDRSVSIHSCHGPDRQVEVLRELLLGLLADDPTLEPRDIVVMCPDIETFAPLISASFGLESEDTSVEHPGHRLRVRLADRSLRQINPLLSALSRVLALVDSRMEASALLDLCAFPPVACQFGFTEDDLERLQDLVSRSGVRWGLDVEHRANFEMGQFAQNTWAAGLDRLLLGVTMDETGQHFIGTALPLDDVDSSDVDLVGRMAELLDRVGHLISELDHRRPLVEWVATCRQTIESLTAVSPKDSWQVTHAYAQLAELAEVSSQDGQVELSLTEVRALLAETFRGRASRANFRTGTLTMCTLMPMRCIPHRVVCLLGVDDGVFPRPNTIDGDDILATDPWIGDRDPRSEDRQLLLDAIMAAQEHLVVIYSGADARTRAPKPPAVPIGALLDTLDQTARSADGDEVRAKITRSHPLQPFDRANFEPPASPSGHPDVFSFDRSSLRGAKAAATPRVDVQAIFDTSQLTTPTLGSVVALADLVRFYSHPIKALLRVRAGLYLGGGDEAVTEQIPVTLGGLDAWAVGDRLLKLRLQGLELGQLTAAEWRRGTLPPQSFGGRALAPVVDNVQQIAGVASPFLTGERRSRDVLVQIGDATVSGTLSSIYDNRLVAVNYSWLAAKHRLGAWLELLALTASSPEIAWQTVTIGRSRRSVLGPVNGDWAARVLADLVDLYRSGLTQPLPLGPKTAHEYARIRFEGKSIAVLKEKLERVWGEERDLAYERFLGVGATVDDLLRQESVPAEERGSLAEPSRFGTLARRVWHPLLASEVIE
jgi:exodeoxyribonuclease V gamma subunit